MDPSSCRVLVVAHDPDMRTVLHAMLSLSGFTTASVAAGGSQAERDASVLLPEVIVIDASGGEVVDDLARRLSDGSPASHLIALVDRFDLPPDWSHHALDRTSIGHLPHTIAELTGEGRG